MSIRRCAALVLGAALGALCVAPHAQTNFPTKPVRLIVPFPPGQATDIMARLLADDLTKVWGQQVIVENRGGGTGIPGIEAGRAAPADGYTITFGTTGTIGVNPGMYAKLSYDPIRDFAMVSGMFSVPYVIVANQSAPYKSLQDIFDAARANPGKLSWGYPGTGNPQHLTGEMLKFRAGVDIVGINYKGSGPAITDLLGGHIPLLVDSIPSALPHIKSGVIRPIAVTSLQRVPQLPDVPTVAESGFPGFESGGWAGIMVPKATPHDIVEKIGADTRKVLNEPSMQQKIAERGGVPDPRGPAEYTEFVKAEIAKWGEVVRRINLRQE